MFDKELSFFKENQSELVKKYGGKILVIKESEIVGVYETTIDAYVNALKSYTLGSFMIQPCTPGPEAYTVTISTSELISG